MTRKKSSLAISKKYRNRWNFKGLTVIQSEIPKRNVTHAMTFRESLTTNPIKHPELLSSPRGIKRTVICVLSPRSPYIKYRLVSSTSPRGKKSKRCLGGDFLDDSTSRHSLTPSKTVNQEKCNSETVLCIENDYEKSSINSEDSAAKSAAELITSDGIKLPCPAVGQEHCESVQNEHLDENLLGKSILICEEDGTSGGEILQSSLIGQDHDGAVQDEQWGIEGPEERSKEEEETLAEMKRLLPTVMELLKENGQDKPLLNFFKLVSDRNFPLDNIAYLLWVEVVNWFSKSNTCENRYSIETKKFWKLGFRMFGGRFIHFMSGHRNAGQVSTGQCERGVIPTCNSNINFAVPNLNTLRDFNPYGLQKEHNNSRRPGIFVDLIELLANSNQSNSCCLTFDGKKLKQGLTKLDGDIDILGYEKVSLDDVKKNQAELVAPVKELLEKMRTFDNIDLSLVENDLTEMVLIQSLKELSTHTLQLLDIRMKKLYGKEKLIERSGDQNWRNGKYVYAISSIIAALHDIDIFLEFAHSTREELLKCLCYMKGSSPVDGNEMNIETCEKYVAIQETSVSSRDTRKVKQRSPEWFDARKEAKVTGSTIFRAVGLDGLQKQKEHFDVTVCGLPERDKNEVTKEAMKHGSDNEINAMATFVGKVLPLLYPECSACEEGYVEYGEHNGKPFMIVSPDGSVSSLNGDNKTVAAIELKCPVRECHKEVPTRYLLQCLSEIEALQVNELIYLCWRPDVSSVFKIKKNSELFSKAFHLCETLYGVETPKRVTKSAKETKQLKEEIITECVNGKTVEFLFVVNSMKHNPEKETTYSTDSFHVSRLCLILESVLDLYDKQYQLKRQPATEALVFLCCDLNREWKDNSVRSAPICWFPKGYSLDTKTMRSVLENVLDVCKEYGLHIPAISFDGQWHNICVRNENGEPLTLLQLQRDVWKKVENMTKATILAELKSMNLVRKWNFERLQPEQDEVTSNNSTITSTVIVAKQDQDKLPFISQRVVEQRKLDIKKKKTKFNNVHMETIHELGEDNVNEKGESAEALEAGSFVDNILCPERDELLESLPEFLSTPHSNLDECCDVINKMVLETNEHTQTSQSLTHTLDTSSETVCSKFSDEETNIVLTMLRSDDKCNKKGEWNGKGPQDIHACLQSAEKLKKLRDVEIKLFARYINKTRLKSCDKIKESESKLRKVSRICYLLGIEEPVIVPKTSKGKKVQRLADLAFVKIQKTYKKSDLNIIYSEYIWEKELTAWMNKLPIFKESSEFYEEKSSVRNSETNSPFWFYHAAASQRRNQLEVSCVDSTHLLTRTRRKICRSGIDGLSNTPWKKVALDGKTALSPAMIDAVTEPMSVSVALAHFTENVEDEMRKNGETLAADLCKDIRQWWESEDNPGIPAKTRIQMRFGLRQRLLSRVNFSHFPPPGMFINGWPSQLWEALLANIDAKTQLYDICEGHAYNVRAFSSMMGETFFSELSLYDKRGQGMVTASEFGQFINSAIEQLNMRVDPNRVFCYRTSRKSVYDLVDKVAHPNDTKGASAIPTESIGTIRDHPFDSSERLRVKGKKKIGTIDRDRNAVKRGSLGVRWENARRNESKLLPTVRMGIELE